MTTTTTPADVTTGFISGPGIPPEQTIAGFTQGEIWLGIVLSIPALIMVVAIVGAVVSLRDRWKRSHH